MQLVFVHGAGGNSLSFYYQLRAFPGSDAVDLPGHPQGTPATSIEGYTEWLRGYIAGKGFRDVVLTGHSMGGAVAQTYALKYPEELRGLILMGTGARLRVHPDIFKMCEEAIKDPGPWLQQRAAAYAKVAPEVREKLLERTQQVGPRVALNDYHCCDKFDIIGDVGQIRLPTLIIAGTQDELTPLMYHDYLESHITGSRKVVIDQATHAAHLEYPEQVNAAIEEFVASLGTKG